MKTNYFLSVISSLVLIFINCTKFYSFLLKNKYIWVAVTGFEFSTTQFVNDHSMIYPNWPNDWVVLWVLIDTVHLTVSYYHVTYASQSESTIYRCLNVKEILTQNRRDIWSLSDSNVIRTHKHFFRKSHLVHKFPSR